MKYICYGYEKDSLSSAYFSHRSIGNLLPERSNDAVSSSMGGGETDVDDFQSTFASIDWDSLIDQAVSQAGSGTSNGMNTTLSDEGISSGLSRIRTRETTTSTVNLFLNIVFSGYHDEASGVTISNGEMSFELNAEKTVTTDDSDASASSTRYHVSSYIAVISDSLTMSNESTTAVISSDNISNSNASMTIMVSGNISSGSITEAIALNVSMNMTSSTGSIIVNGSSHDFEESVPETPSVSEPEVGSSERPYQVATEADFIELATAITNTSGTFYVEIIDDIVLSNDTENPSITISSEFDIDMDLGGNRISRVASGAAETASGEAYTYGDQSQNYVILNEGSLFIHDGTLGGTLFENPVARFLHSTSDSSLVMENIEVLQFADGYEDSAITIDGEAEINSVTISSTHRGITMTETANAVIRDSAFYGIASNAMGGRYGGAIQTDGAFIYPFSSYGILDMDDTVVYGIQGAIGIDGGTSTLGDGVEGYVSAEVFDMVSDEFHDYYLNWLNDQDNSHTVAEGEFFYALYIAGEDAEFGVSAINGGTYVSYGPATVHVGNNADGGAGHAAYAVINGGTFENRRSSGGEVVTDTRSDGVSDGEYGYGVLDIYGGRFKDNGDTRENLSGFVNPETHTISDEPDAEGFYTVTAL